jgi:hypothetical protein
MTLNQYINLFKGFAQTHLQLKGNFGQGDLWELVHSFNDPDGSQNENRSYPLMWCDIAGNNISGNEQTKTFTFVFCDRVQRDERDERDALNDTEQMAQDFVAWCNGVTNLSQYTKLVQNVNMQDFTQGHQDYVAGWVVTVQFKEAFRYDRCNIPATASTPFVDCLPVRIYEDGVLVDTIPAGGKYEYSSSGGGCGEIEVYVRDEDGQEVSYFIDPEVSTIITLNDVTATVKNSANTTIGSGLVSPIIGGTVTVNDITFTDTDNTTSSKAAGINFSATLIPALSAAQLNDVDDGLTFTQKDNLTALLDIKTGQTISYRTGDDGDIEQGSLLSFVVLSAQNPYGNSNRFTDTLGGQTYADGIIVDWSRRLMWYNPAATANWNNSIDAALSSNQGGFTDWHIPNVQQAQSIMNYGNSGGMLNYTPFNISFASMWTSTTSPDTTTSAFRVLATGATTAGGIAQVGKTTTNNYMYCRIFSLSDLGL